MPGDWMIYGANGFTGQRIVAEAATRGRLPVVAGRSARAIRALAAQYGCQASVFQLGDPAQTARQIEGMRLVLHCAGPFSTTAAPMREACLLAGAHYLDITGEIDAIEAAAALDERAAAAGVAIIPAVGFDVVPSDCLAMRLSRQLPDAVRLELAFTSVGQLSPGTTRTIVEQLPRGGRVRRDGRIVDVPLAWRSKEIPFADGPQWAMTVPWGDVASAWHSTRIPNIEVYLATPRDRIRLFRLARPMTHLLRLPVPVSWMQRILRRLMSKSSAGEPRPAYAQFWGRASDAADHAVEATLRTPEGYRLTVLTALAAVERVLRGQVAAGFATPAMAFGPDFIDEVLQAHPG